MQTPSVDLGPAPTATSTPSVGDILKLVYASGDAAGPLGTLDLAGLERQQLRELEAALVERGEVLSQAERDAIARGEPQELKALLERLRHKERAERPPAPSADRGDGVTQSRARLPERSPEAKSHLPEHEPELAHEPHRGADARTRERPSSGGGRPARSDPRGFSRLLLRAPEGRERDLKEAKLSLHAASLRAERRPGVGGRQAAVARRTEPTALGSKHHAPGSAPAFSFVSGLPLAGHSGTLDRLPLLQFAPPRLHAVLEALGIRTLADFLGRAALPEGRALLARLLGLPSGLLLLAAHRAELLDLPLAQRPLHLNEARLLAHLGVRSLAQLAALHEVFLPDPEKLDLFSELVALLQKALPDLRGRGRLTRHDLRAWIQAARERPGEVRSLGDAASPREPTTQAHPAEHALEEVLAWHLEPLSDLELRWRDVSLRLLAWLRHAGVEIPLALRQRLEASHEAERFATWQSWLARDISAAEATRREDAEAAFAPYSWRDEEDERPSLFTDLDLEFCPDRERDDHHICFWVDSGPLCRRVLGPDGLDTVVPQYVCMSLETGVVAPFGAGL